MLNSFNWFFLPVFNVDGYKFTQEVCNTAKIINSDPRSYYIVLCWGREISSSSFSLRFVHSFLLVCVNREIEKAPNSLK